MEDPSLPSLRHLCDVYMDPRKCRCGGGVTLFYADCLTYVRDLAKAALNIYNEKEQKKFYLEKVVKLNRFVLHRYLTFWARSAESDERRLFRAVVDLLGGNKVLLCEIKDDEEITIPADHEDYPSEDDRAPYTWRKSILTDGSAGSSIVVTSAGNSIVVNSRFAVGDGGVNLGSLASSEFGIRNHGSKNRGFQGDVVASYIVDIRALSLRILELICEGLGLEKGYFEETSQVQSLTASNYPPYPNPGLTLGLLKHVDHSLITILLQGNAEGHQVLKDGHWIEVELVPDAFVVNIGSQIEIISNAEHRVVTNPKETRTTFATFINPLPDCIIEPAKSLVDESNPPLRSSMSFQELVRSTCFVCGPQLDLKPN